MKKSLPGSNLIYFPLVTRISCVGRYFSLLYFKQDSNSRINLPNNSPYFVELLSTVVQLLFSSHQPIGPQAYPVIYVVANPVLYVVCWTEKDQRNISTKLQREEKKNTTKPLKKNKTAKRKEQ